MEKRFFFVFSLTKIHSYTYKIVFITYRTYTQKNKIYMKLTFEILFYTYMSYTRNVNDFVEGEYLCQLK